MFTGGVTWQLGGEYAATVLADYLDMGIYAEDTPLMPAGLADLLGECLNADPVERPQDMPAVAQRLADIFNNTSGLLFPRQQPRGVELRADSLNNKALSLLDLGDARAAAAAWQDALKADPYHADSLYNQFLFHWQVAKDVFGPALFNGLRVAAEKFPGDWQRWQQLGTAYQKLHFTAGMDDAISRSLKLAPQEKEVLETCRAAQIEKASRPSIERTFDLNGGMIHSMSVLPGERNVLINADGRLFDLISGEYIGWQSSGLGSYSLMVALGDGALFLAAEENKFHLIDALKVREKIHTFEAHTAAVNALALHPDRRLAASGGADQLIILWDLTTRNFRQIFLHGAAVTALVFSPDGKSVISAGEDQTLKVWDILARKCVQSLPCGIKKVSSLALSQDGNFLLVAGEDSPLQVWDLREYKKSHFFGNDIYDRVIIQTPQAICLAANSKSRVFDERQNFVSFFDLATGLELSYLEFPLWQGLMGPYLENYGRIYCIAAIPGSREFLCGGYNALYLVDPGSLQMPARPQFNVTKVQAPEEYADAESQYLQLVQSIRKALDAGQWDRAKDLVAQARQISAYAHHPALLDAWAELGRRGVKCGLMATWLRKTVDRGSAACLALAPDGAWYAAGDEDGRVYLYDFASDRRLELIKQHSGPVRQIRISENGETLLSFSDDGYSVWQRQDGKWSSRIQDFGENYGYLRSLSSDGRLALSSADQEVTVWSALSGEIIRQFKISSREQCQLSPDGEWLLTVSSHSASLEDLRSGGWIDAFSYEDVSSACITPDRTRMLIGTDIGAINIKNIDSGEIEEIPEEAEASRIVSSADSRYLLSSGWFDGVNLWDLQAKKLIHRFEGNDNPSFEISMDGRYVLIEWEQTYQVWELEWNYEFPDPADWDERAAVHLKIFLLHHGSTWTEEDLQQLMIELGNRGFGWLGPEGVRRQLMELSDKGT